MNDDSIIAFELLSLQDSRVCNNLANNYKHCLVERQNFITMLQSYHIFQRNFALSPLNCLRFGVRLIAEYFHATELKNVFFSNFNLV